MTRPPSGALRRAWRWTRWLILGLLLPLLLLAGFGQWWLLPRLNDYRDSLAAMLSEMLQVPVQIDTVAGGQDGGRLALRLRGVTLHHPQTGATLAHFSQATAALDLWRSLQEWRPAFSHIRLEGANLTLEQGPDGAPRLRTDASSTETASTLPEIARWLFTVGRLEIFGEQLTVLRPDGTTFNLLHPWFQVRETGNGQQLIFTTELPTERGERLQLTVERAPNPPEVWQWQGQVQFNDLAVTTSGSSADGIRLMNWGPTVSFDNLTVTAAQQIGATLMIRGLRDGTDLDYEMQLAGMNETMAPTIHTVFLPASVGVRPITATLVRQIAKMGGDVSAFVPAEVASALTSKFAAGSPA